MNPRGSVWNRWDPHLHAPGTILNDQFKGDWEAYLQHIEKADPPVRALGVTDYLSIETYREVLQKKSSERLPGVDLIFPNVEMRLDVSTEKQASINLHLLFSPDDPNHVSEIERILGLLTFSFGVRLYQCTRQGLEDLGRTVEPQQSDSRGARRVGAQQFKTTLDKLRELFKSEKWLEKNCLVAVSGGSGDGTAGLQNDSSYRATRIEIERFANIILSGSPAQREFWLGRTPNVSVEHIERNYGCLKPCLHGSDAHAAATIAKPDLQRFCWIKGDLTFESLRQVVLEPEERVWIGPTPPDGVAPSYALKEIKTTGTHWLVNADIPLNSGLVAIIGARGSGKTALVDMLAAGAGAIERDPGSSSFLNRASEHLEDAKVTLHWGDGAQAETRPLLGERSFDEEGTRPEVCYLSQHFVEKLCSAAGLAIALRREMERVVFEAIDSTERLEADSFEDLARIVLEAPRFRRGELLESIASIANEIVKEDLLYLKRPRLIAQRNTSEVQITKDKAQLAKLLPKSQEERAKRLAALEEACTNAETRVEALHRRAKLVEDLIEEINNTRYDSDARRLADIKRRFAALGLSETDWAAFGTRYVGDVDSIVNRAKSSIDRDIKVVTQGDPARQVDRTRTPLKEWPLNLLRTEREALRKEVGIDAQKQRAYSELQRAIGQKEVALKRIEAEIAHAEGSPSRRKELILLRRDNYKKIIETIIREEDALRRLYEPLSTQLKEASGSLSKLQFRVRREVNFDKWVVAGEEMLDLRKASPFQGRGSLKQKAKEELMPAWLSGTAEQVSEAMDGFRERYAKDFLSAQPTFEDEEGVKKWTQSVALWLYDASHIGVTYGIEYDGVSVERLSPGTRGIVLLLLYLAIDRQDNRPLLIDQPEENLDPKSVFEELVPYFREARKRRQVIIVTHNANLVVNTDAEQVIVATAVPDAVGGLPSISYTLGGLENEKIRDAVCDILEGGRRAFLERARRYRIRL